MNNKIIIVFFSLLLLTFSHQLESSAQGIGPSLEISDPDCDTASGALSNLMGDLKDNTLSLSEKAVYERVLKNNATGYKGDPEKCIMVSQDFVKVLSIDALALYKDKRHQPIFKRLLFHRSELQPGDIRQHAAEALADIKAYGAYPDILKSARDKQTFMVGYKKDIPSQNSKPTLKELVALERRNLRLDPYSYPITKALKSLATNRYFEITKSAIEAERELHEKEKSAWNDAILGDMLRIAASIDTSSDVIKLIEEHTYLSSLSRLRAFSHIRNNLIIAPVSMIIQDSAKAQNTSVPIEMKLGFYLLSKLGTKQSVNEITALSKSDDKDVSFMAHVFLAKNGSKNSLDVIKQRIASSSDRLKMEGMKLIAQRKDRNAVPLIKNMIAGQDLKLRVCGIWSLARLGVIDPKYNAEKLIKEISPRDEDKVDLALIGSLKEAVDYIAKVKPAY